MRKTYTLQAITNYNTPIIIKPTKWSRQQASYGKQFKPLLFKIVFIMSYGLIVLNFVQFVSGHTHQKGHTLDLFSLGFSVTNLKICDAAISDVVFWLCAGLYSPQILSFTVFF